MDCDIPWVTTTDVKRFRYDGIDSIADTEVQISQLGLRNSSAVMHPAGTVVLTRTSASAGFSIVMDVPMATSQDCATWTPGPLLNSFYLLWCLRAMRRDVMERLAMGSTHKTIYFPDLEGIRIPLPPMVEQREIVERISSRVNAIRSAQGLIAGSIKLLEERKRALITAAVTGEFDVTTATGRGVA
jgi:type I restriction enzyme S subunit